MNKNDLQNFFSAVSAFKKTGLIKECFHHNKEECKGNIKQSHSLQRNGRLSIIESEVNGNNSIYTFTSFIPSYTNLMHDLKPIGKKEASTFFGFCDYHDSTLFSKIENSTFDQSDEHCFLHSYRSYAHSYHRKREQWKAYNTESKFTQVLGKKHIEIMKIGILMGINDSIERKKYLDEKIDKKQFDGLAYLVYEKEGLYPFAVSSQISPKASYKNKSMNNHLNPNDPFSQIMLTFLPDVNSTIAILAAFPDDKKAINLLYELESLKDHDLEVAITSLIIANCENTFFSPIFWHSLSKPLQRLLLDEFDNNTSSDEFSSIFFKSRFNFFNEKYEVNNLIP